MSLRFTKIDELLIGDHSYLHPEDTCYFVWEYTARKGFSHSQGNDIILNLKKGMDKKGLPGWHYKEETIRYVGVVFRKLIKEDWLKSATLVPIPPSVVKDDPMYDNRVGRILQEMGQGLELDIREIVLLKDSVKPHHSYEKEEKRPGPEQLRAMLQIEEGFCEPTPSAIGVFDDVLTTGGHFKALQSLLQERFPSVPVCGFFVARRVPESDFEEIFGEE